MAATRICAIIGRKNAGKTTLTVALAAEFTRRGLRVMTIKHATHPADVDRPGTDTWRHFHEGHAERTLIASPELRVIFERSPDTMDPVSLARRYLDGADLVLVEGFKRARLPRIEVFRRETGDGPIYDPRSPEAGDWVAILTDDAAFEAPPSCRVLRFSDTMWLRLLTSLAWDRAAILPP